MIDPKLAAPCRLAALLLLAPLAPAAGWAQDEPAADPIERIDAEFAEKFRELERERLGQLAELAGSGEGPEAVRVLETYFRSALGAGLFEEAEPLAERILDTTAPSPVVRYLAEVVNIMAEADRGAFEESLRSLVRAVEAGKEGDEPEAELARRALPASARLSLLDTYYQRVVQAGEFDVARKAFGMVLENAQDGDEPAVQEYLAHRIKQLDMIGRPAPSFQGIDADGRPIRLEDYAGRPVLLVFWATWYRPNADQVAWMKQAFASYRERGLQILGVNLDALADGGRPAEAIVPEVRRYALEYNIPWPNLINAPGEGDVANAYGVTEIPASVLIDREGRIASLDLNAANFGREVGRVLGGAE